MGLKKPSDNQEINELAMRRIMKETVKEAVHETLTGLGFNTEHPHEMQADLRYLHKTRKGSEFLALRAKTSLLAFMVPTALYILWEALKEGVKK